MGIFRPTKITGDIVIYSKWCVSCMHPEELMAINLYALHHDFDVQIIRTAYRPADHKEATQIWSTRNDTNGDGADYPTFIIYNGVFTVKEFSEMITDDAKNKMVPEGKTKDDMQRLPKTKRPRRKNSMASAADKPEVQTTEQE